MNWSKQSVAAILVCLVGIGAGNARGDGRKGIKPAHPLVLFKTLPQNVEGWKLTTSKGWMGKGVWLESSVIREFEEMMQPEKKKKTRKPGKTRLTIQDTAKFKGSDIDLFANFKPAKYPRCEYLMVRRYPAIVTQSKSGKHTVQLLVRKRWILSIRMENQRAADWKKWLGTVKLAALSQIQDGPAIERPEKVLSVSINELEGTNSQFASYEGTSKVSESDITEEDFEEVDADSVDESVNE